MNILPEIDKISNELKKIFKDLHQHPELGFEEVRTSEIVKKRLEDFGVDEIHTNIGKTGVVAVINGKQKGANQIGLRADWMHSQLRKPLILIMHQKTRAKCMLVGTMGILQCYWGQQSIFVKPAILKVRLS